MSVRPIRSRGQARAIIEFLLTAGYTENQISRATPCTVCGHTREIVDYNPRDRKVGLVCRHLGCPALGETFWRGL